MQIFNKSGECQFETIKKEDGHVDYKFYNKTLENELSKQGIHIPDYMKKNYGGRTWIKINDPGFLIALKFYVRTVLSQVGFKLVE